MADNPLVATESFACTYEEHEIVVRVGDVIATTHPIAKTHAALFEPIAPKATHELPEPAKMRRSNAKGG